VVVLVAAVGSASLGVVVRQPLGPDGPARGSLALDLPARTEIAVPAANGASASGEEQQRAGTDPSPVRDVAPSGTRSAPARCLDGVACRVWQVDLLDGTEPDAIVAGAGVVVVPSVRELRTYDARTGELRWSVGVRAPGNRVVAPRAAIAGGLVLVAGTGDRLHAYALDDGERSWSATIAGLEQVGDAREIDGQLVVLVRRTGQRTTPSTLLTVDPADGAPGWELDVDAAILTDEGPVSHQRGVGLRGHDPQDGVVRWSALQDQAVGDLRPAGRLVVVAADEDRLLLDAATGEQVARLPRVAMVGPFATETTTVVPGGDRVLLVDGGGVVWDVEVPGGCCTGHLVGVDDVTLRRSDGSLLVLDRTDGGLLEQRAPLHPDGDDVPGWLLGGLEFSVVPDVGTELRFHVRDVRTGRLLEELAAVTPVAVLGSDVLVASSDQVLRLTPRPRRSVPTGPLQAR
jgi:outer membrane protein assembly factor BamB